ncbi:nutrient deprivation-induced protein [Rhizobium leguminosarum]|uniref:nutrient deprivation-induced protein n=1 Tax=Rhizobium leguminosarum TaxID=384 RepID=UPI001C92605A|nr:nutrient deprivation-induced protein [Rhizobium leguminosarum]MBY2926714.1 nutrient deprivation-induced protein [Rhizobium leguminosarum]MBY2937108.1 nutrient deprivation-induced protein [Rhizobium leguminosarum]MBY3027017.1 nutrient deprivation-induced protein [Rhizobium leguminosarum]
MSNEFTEMDGRPRPSSETSLQSKDAMSSPQPSASLAGLKEKLADDVTAAKNTIKEGAETAVEKVKEVVSDQTTFAARQVGGVAKALEKVGAELEASDQPEVGRYAKQIGRSFQGFATQMQGKDIGEIAAMAEEFGRKQPLAFLGIAALAGLSASRFLTASAKRAPSQAKRRTSPATPTGSSTTGGYTNG